MFSKPLDHDSVFSAGLLAENFHQCFVKFRPIFILFFQVLRISADTPDSVIRLKHFMWIKKSLKRFLLMVSPF